MWRSALIVAIVTLGLLLVGLLAHQLGLSAGESSAIALSAGCLVLMLGPLHSWRFHGRGGAMLRYALIWAAILAGVALLYWGANRLLPAELRLDEKIEEEPLYTGPTQTV